MRFRSTSRRARSGLPVLTYLSLSFGLSVAALVGLVASTTIASFHAERHRVAASLRAAVQVSADKVAEQNRQTLEYMAPLAAQPAVAALDPSRCDSAFGGLGSMLAAYGHLYTFTAAGARICSQGAPGLDEMLSPADWQSALAQGTP